MRPYREITDEEWRAIAPLLPENRPRRDKRGRPLSNTRAVMNGVLWVISTETSWSSLPRTFPPYQTCHRRFKAWHDEGVLEEVIQRLFGEQKDAVYALVLKRMRQTQAKREEGGAAGDTDTPEPPGGLDVAGVSGVAGGSSVPARSGATRRAKQVERLTLVK